jgi:hypothetical protein
MALPAKGPPLQDMPPKVGYPEVRNKAPTCLPLLTPRSSKALANSNNAHCSGYSVAAGSCCCSLVHLPKRNSVCHSHALFRQLRAYRLL